MLRICLLAALVGCGTETAAVVDAAGGSDAGQDAPALGDGGIPSPSLGGNVHPGGATFRIWAPHAQRAWVVGDFTPSDAGIEMESEDGGTFAVDVEGAAAGQHYKYLVESGGQTATRLDPRSRAVTNSRGTSVLVDPNAYAWQTSDFHPAPPQSTVIYEMHIGAFNPTITGRPGTYASAAAKLDYLAQLGVTALEVMPVAEFPGDFSWGYNPALPMAPESAYGSPDDLRSFVDQAHARGIAVILDVVHNHWGSGDLKQCLWCFDGDCLGSGGIYFYTDSRQSTPWGPRPDFGRSQVRQYIIDSVLGWTREYRMDGMRWDSTVNIRQVNGTDLPDGWRLLNDAMAAVHAADPETLQVAEDFRDDDRVTAAQSSGGLGFDSQWDGDFFHPIDTTIEATTDAARSMPAVAAAITHRLSGRATARVIYTEDHDEVANGKQRIPQMISPSDPGSLLARKLSTLGAAIVMTSPGIPMIFMGQEFLEDGYFSEKTPLDWTKTTTYAGILAMYRDMIAMRRTLPGLSGGNVQVHHVNDSAKVIAYRRWGANDDVVVVANFSGRAFAQYIVGFPAAGAWHVRFNSDAQTYSADFGGTPSADVVAAPTARDGQPASGSVALGAYSLIVLSR